MEINVSEEKGGQSTSGPLQSSNKSRGLFVVLEGIDGAGTTTQAKNIVAAGLSSRCEIQVSYAIGVAEPTSISIDTFGTANVSEARIVELVREHFDLRPKGLINMLNLKRPIYQPTAAYGHFGREQANFTWEQTDKADALRAAAGL